MYFWTTMKGVTKVYRLFNILSLDVAAGAVISTLLFAKIYAAVPSTASLITLGLTVWIIYTTDRLLDVHGIKEEVASARHRFHQRHQATLKFWLILITMIDGVMLYFIEAVVIKMGLILSLVVAIYILLRTRLYLFKELFIALLYTAGVVLPVFPIHQISLQTFLPLVPFFFIALLNLIIFSRYERENDMHDNQPSIATILNETSIEILLAWLFVITFSITGVLVLSEAYFVSLVYIIMTLTLFLIYRYTGFFARNDFYRLAGDAVFLVPLIYILK